MDDLPAQPHEHDLRANHLIEMGRIAVSAARLESTVSRMLSDLITHDSEISAQVLGGMSFERMVSLTRVLLGTILGADHQMTVRCGACLTDATDVMRERNRMMHGLWTYAEDESPGVPSLGMTTRTRKGPVIHESDIQVQTLRGLADRIGRVSGLLEVLSVGLLHIGGAFEELPSGGIVRKQPHRPSPSQSA